MNIVLCGYKSCGKTTVGKAFSNQYGSSFIDTDDLIIESYNDPDCSIRLIHDELGEVDFRKVEANAIKSINNISNTIIATGGGVILNPDNINHLKSLGKLIYLYVESNTIYQRILADDTIPSFVDKNNIQEDLLTYLTSRDELYQQSADYIIDTTEKTIDQIISLTNQYRCKHGK